MNPLSIFTLKALRKIYAKAFRVPHLSKPACEQDPDKASEIIFDALKADKPCMIARFGAFELSTVVNYFGVKSSERSVLKYIGGKQGQWWWNERTINYLHTNAGFFPPIKEKIEQFCELMLEDMKEVDVLGSWLAEERYFGTQIKNALKVELRTLEPYFATEPWTLALENKKVLVVHPFRDTIESQYKKRTLLFNNNLLPQFQLQTIKAIQSLGGVDNGFNDWFEALEYMKNEISKCDFDICLIGCGAYGFPLAAYVKRMGKKAIHLGGSTQLLFGIKGKRWDDSPLYNEYWCSPCKLEKPKNSDSIEKGCYW